MNLKKVSVINKGMVQDVSVSKSSQEFAFENHNIRIITNDDHTSMSITNIQGPRREKFISLKGVVIGKCILDRYVVIFTHAVPTEEQSVYGYGYTKNQTTIKNDPTPDRIYRLDLQTEGGKEKFVCRTLFEGNLNFDEEHLIDTTYFMENANVVKVYWTDGLNNPRFINIITEGERTFDDTAKKFTPYTNGKIFDFYPTINKTPKIALSKTTEFTSELPNGMAQYFVSYYNENGAETLIAANSNMISIDYAHRGAKADDPAGSCSVVLKITNLDKSFDYVRVYSAIRTAEYGELSVRIVRDIKIQDDSVEIIDNGIDQEAISPAQLFYIGGQVLIAKTLTQKDGTLFLGNLTKTTAAVPEKVYNDLTTRLQAYNAQFWTPGYDEGETIFTKNSFIKTPFLHFNQNKVIQTFDDSVSAYYPYKRQVLEEASKYRTFKGGETYRFGIQFQTDKGEWTDVVWLGDLECNKRPITHDDGSVDLNNLAMVQGELDILFTSAIKKALTEAGIKNYRIMMADPVKHNGRKIKAQGVLCPTLFNLRDRYLGKYAHASWIMRPRNNKASFHHLEPLVDYKSEGAEIVTKYTDTYPNVTYDTNRTETNTYVGIVYMPSFTKNCVYVKYVEFESDYVSNNTYDFAGKSKMTVVKEKYFKDSTSLSNLLGYVSEEEKQKITSSGFSGLYNDQLKSFFTSFAIGIVVAASAFIGMGVGQLVGMVISEVLCMLGTTVVSASIPLIFEVLTPMVAAAAAGAIKIPATCTVSPNADESQLKELLGDTWDKLPSYMQEMVKRGIIQMPVPGNPKTDAIYNIPIAQRLSEMFSDTEYVYYPMYSDGSTIKSYGFPVTSLPKVFQPDSFDGADYVFFQIYQKQTTSGFDLNVNNDYFVDESILTLHSPEITEDSILNSDYKCKVVGYVPIEENNYISAQIEMNPAPYGESGGIDYEFLNNKVNNLYEYTPFYSGGLYRDATPLSPDLYQSYRCYLFGPGDIVGSTTEELDGNPKSVVKKKQILNHSYSANTKYFNNKNNEKKYDASVRMFSEAPVSIDRPDLFPITLYEGNYENAYIVKDMEHIHGDASKSFAKTDEMINIQFHSTAHAVLNFFPPQTLKDRIPLMPILGGVNNPNRYLSIKDNRISGSGAWKHDALSGNRGLIWDSHFSNMSNNFTYVDYAWLHMEEASYTNAEWHTKIQERFKNEGKWKLYSVSNKAIGVNYSLTYPEANLDYYSTEGWFTASNFRNHVIQYYDKAGHDRPYLTHFYVMSEQKPTGSSSYSSKGFANVLQGGTAAYFIQYLLYYSLYTYEYAGNTYIDNDRLAWFVLGLLYFFDSGTDNVPYYDKSNYYRMYYKIPDCVSDTQGFKNSVKTFRAAIKELFLYCEMILFAQEGTAEYKDIEKNITQSYNKICSAIDALKSIYVVDVAYVAQQWHIKYGDRNKSGVDEEGNYYNAIKKYAFANIKYSDGRQYQDGYPANGLVILHHMVTYTDDRADTLWKTSTLLDDLKNKIKSAYKYFLQQSYNSSICTKKWKTLKWTDYYSFDKNSKGDITLVSGYDNSKGYLKYKGEFYAYSGVYGNSLVKVNLQNTDLYYQDYIDVDEPKDKPYLMMAEIYNDIPYESLYGGHSETAIKKLTWYPVTEATPIGTAFKNSFGDTVYQRYDCLKTYPASEEDINQNVDITSFMVESHINLDDRTDENRGKFNIMSRPTNFNLFNNAYNMLNDTFTYQTRQSDSITNKYPNQFVWTLSKNYLGSVDTWTNASFLSLNQCKYPITKLCSFRDKLISLNTKSVEFIDFNAKNLVPTNDGFIELQNNSKVTGTASISDLLGTSNMSVQFSEKGVYFVEDNENNIVRLNYDGSIFRIGLARMESWMKQNIKVGDHTYNHPENIHLEYDQINKELHILNNEYCLVYNETLESFTAFLDLQDTVFMFPFNGKLWSFGHLNGSNLYEMYGGFYNSTYDGFPIDYSLHYRVNPEGSTDKVFTNIEFVADMDVNDLNAHKTPALPFDYIRAWNEYQDTNEQKLNFYRDNISNLKQKFRIWRADIPRDANSKWGRDRIRNPWIHLVLGKHTDPHTDYDSKFEMHNLEVQYMS